MKKFPRKLFAVGAIVGGAVVGGIAFAAWTSTGTGSATAKAQTAQALSTVDASASSTADLYPGATGDATLRISNPNPYPVQITSVAQTGPVVSDKGPACDASTGVTFSDQADIALAVPADGVASFTIADAVAMANSSDNTCQGAVFTIPVTLTGASSAG